MLVLTEQAKEVIRGIVEEIGPEGGLRITASGSNGGTAFDFDMARAPGPADKVVVADGAKVFLDEAAAAVLADKTLDIEEHDDHFHFSLGEQSEAAQA